MNQNKKQISYDVLFKETSEKKELPPKTKSGRKNLKRIEINQHNFHQMSSTFSHRNTKNEKKEAKPNGNKRITK